MKEFFVVVDEKYKMYCPAKGLCLQPSVNELEILTFKGDVTSVDWTMITQWSSLVSFFSFFLLPGEPLSLNFNPIT